MKSRIEFAIYARWGRYLYEENNRSYPKHWCIEVRDRAISYPIKHKLPLAEVEARARELFNPEAY